MDPTEPFLRAAPRCPLGAPDEVVPPRREIQRVGDEIPIPQYVFGAAHRPFVLLFTLAQLLLGTLPFGDILTRGDHANHLAGFRTHGIRQQLDGEQGAILVSVEGFALPAIEFIRLFSAQRLGLRPGGWREDDAVLADQLVHGVPVHLGLGRIAIANLSVQVGDRDAELHRLDGLAEREDLLVLGRVSMYGLVRGGAGPESGRSEPSCGSRSGGRAHGEECAP